MINEAKTDLGVGAVVTFSGVVRGISPEGDEIKALHFERFEELMNEKVEMITKDLEEWDDVHKAIIFHKVGRVKRGEDIVYIVVSAGHRVSAFKACREAIERVKAEVPIWKKEISEENTYWVHDLKA